MSCQPASEHQVYIWLRSNQTCLLCDELSDTPSPMCVPCESELPWLGAQCETCALPLQTAQVTCSGCLQRPPAFTQVVAPWRYDFPVDALITRFKHRANWPIGRLLGELLVQHLQHRFDEGLPRPDALLPVPLAKKRLRERGYNQAAMLAGWIGKSLELPVNEQQLQRIKETPTQQGLDARARKRNLNGAFALKELAWFDGKHLALVDDVVTTGSTAEGIARLLLNAGAQRVDVYCLARTPRPED
ncbi:ComF family protein [Pseudomonas sp. R1-18]|uniref:ComF family protein n=1 Tax=Pseudomonas sp. R1-18 TaxID=1632772 RepID=UPI003DA90ED9